MNYEEQLNKRGGPLCIPSQGPTREQRCLPKPSALGRQLPNRNSAFLDEEGLGIYGKRHLAGFAGVLPRHDLQGSLDALGLHHHPETRGAAAHLDRDPYHLPTPSFRVKLAMIVTYRLYFTILTVNSETKSERENLGDLARRQCRAYRWARLRRGSWTRRWANPDL